MGLQYNEPLYTDAADTLELLVIQEGELAQRLIDAERKIKELTNH